MVRLAYATANTVLTRHIVWRQSKEALIAPATRRAVVISEILGALPDGLVGSVRADLEAVLSNILRAEVRSGVLDAARPSMELRPGPAPAARSLGA